MISLISFFNMHTPWQAFCFCPLIAMAYGRCYQWNLHHRIWTAAQKTDVWHEGWRFFGQQDFSHTHPYIYNILYIYKLYGKIGEVDVVYFVILIFSYGWSIYVWIWLLCPFLYAKCRVNNTQAGDFSWLGQPETEGRWTPHSKKTWRFV